ASFNAEKFGRIFITGRSGSGKSHTVGVLIEEMIKKQIALMIIDRHGEYSSLKLMKGKKVPENDPFFQIEDPTSAFARYIVEFGDPELNPGVDLDLDYLLACKTKDLISMGQCTIINLRGLDLSAQKNITELILTRLYEASTKREIPPCFLFIDEAHEFAGKKKDSVMEKVRLIAQEGRKFGINLAVITQRPQALDVTLRAQAGTWFIHKLTDINDVKITCKSAEGISSGDDEEIQFLGVGESIITGEITPSAPLQVKIRERYTVHGGAGYNILDYVKGGKIHRTELIEQIKKGINLKELEKSKKINKRETKSLGELYSGLEELEIESKILSDKNQLLNSENAELKITVKKLQGKYDKEKKRAESAVAVAEKAVKELKKHGN
ncbi:MAG: ATP-binding protein, partial [Promethearchaeota archaeon]